MACCQSVTDEQIIESLKANAGFIQLAANALGVTRTVFYDRAKTSQAVRDAIIAVRESQREGRVLLAEQGIDKLLSGEVPHFGAAELTLSRLGRDRGWAPDKQGSQVNVAIQFQVEQLVPEDLLADPPYIENTASSALPESATTADQPIMPAALPPSIEQEPD